VLRPQHDCLHLSGFLNRLRMFDSCRGHSQSLYPSRFCSFRRPICAERDFLNSCPQLSGRLSAAVG
jgi:hypothetical protein